KVEGTRAWINLGDLSGIKVGDRFGVFDAGEALIDPDTGAKLGSDERQTGSGAVVEVQSKFAVINFTGAAKAKDTIRKQWRRSRRGHDAFIVSPIFNAAGGRSPAASRPRRRR